MPIYKWVDFQASQPAIASDNEVIDMIIDAVKTLIIKENAEPVALPDKKTAAGIIMSSQTFAGNPWTKFSKIRYWPC